MEESSVKTRPKKVLPNNVVTVNTTMDVDFFKWWCVFLRPFIRLTDREIDVISSFLSQRWELSKHISDPAILDKILMSEDIRLKVQESCGLSSQHLYVVMNHLRKKKAIIDNRLNPRLIPNRRKDGSDYFQLLILFKEGGEK